MNTKYGAGGVQPQASDLLATHSIHELRNLVQTLQKDCESQKSELQMMVGSKYHDFIESADAISSMHAAAAAVGHNISSLSELGKEVIEKSLVLLDAHVPQSVVNSISQKRYCKSDLTCTQFWERLNECDVFGASELLVTSGVLRSILSADNQLSTAWLGLTLACNSNEWTRLHEHAMRAEGAEEKLYESGGEMESLRQVALEDGFFLLLLANEKDVYLNKIDSVHHTDSKRAGPSLSPRQTADTLAALTALRSGYTGDNAENAMDSSVFTSTLDPSLLASSYASFMESGGQSDGSMGRGDEAVVDMLKLYLHGATERIYAAIEGMQSSEVYACAAGEGRDEWTLHVDMLLNAISALQRTILDVYLMFFQSISEHETDDIANTAQSEHRTLIDLCCGELSAGIIGRLNAMLSEGMDDGEGAAAQDTICLRLPGHPLSTSTGHGMRSAEDTRRRLHETWSQWMYGKRATGSDAGSTARGHLSLYDSMVSRGGATTALSNACVFCLQLIKASSTSGGDVSVLQNKVRAACASTEAVLALQCPQDYGYKEPHSGGSSEIKTIHSMKSKNMQRAQRAYSDAAMGSGEALALTEGVLDTTGGADDSGLSTWRNKLWHDANKTLLLAYKPLVSASVSGGGRPGAVTRHPSNSHLEGPPEQLMMNLLWSRVFRKPFLHQVESALHASSVSGLYRVQQRLFRALYCVGVVVNVTSTPKLGAAQEEGEDSGQADAVEYAVSVHPAPAHSGAHYNPSHISSKPSRTPCSSVHIYHLADEIRTALSHELSDLRTGIQLSDEDGESGDPKSSATSADKESTQTLARSVQIYSCQMVGQVVALTRCIAEVCTTLSTSHNPPVQSVPIEGYIGAWNSVVADALLLLGRFCWLLKVNGNFVATSILFSLSPKRGPSSAAIGHSSSAGDSDDEGKGHNELTYYTSYDQLQSAFDIADSDGDGLITYHEAIEALQALCVGDEGGTAEEKVVQHRSLANCLWPSSHEGGDQAGPMGGKDTTLSKMAADTTVTSFPYAGQARIASVLPPECMRFSLTEFKLLCAKYIPVNAQAKNGFKMFCRALDSIVRLSHEAWSRRVVMTAEPTLRQVLDRVYNGSDDAASVCGMKDTWTDHIIEGEGDEESTSIHLPSIPSEPVRTYLRELIGHVNYKISSVDSNQVFFASKHCNSSDNDDDEPCQPSVRVLAECVSVSVSLLALDSVSTCVAEVLKQLSKCHNSEDDTMATQLLFDLLVLQRTLCISRAVKDSSEGKRAQQLLVKSIDQCQDAIDPITIHLALPIIENCVAKYCSRRQLLSSFPLLVGEESVSAEGTQAEAKAVPVQRQVFFTRTPNEGSPGEKQQQRFNLLPLPSMHSTSSSHRMLLNAEDNAEIAEATAGKAGHKGSEGKAAGSPSGGGSSSMLSIGNSITGLTSYLTRSGASTTSLSGAK